jgi:ubiquinone biosynthesis protein Coq4
MVDDAIRNAWQSKVEDLGWGGPTMAPVVRAVRAHGGPALTGFFEQMLLQSRGVSEALAGRQQREPDRLDLARCRPGTLGHCVAETLAMRGREQACAPTADGHGDAEFLAARLDSSREVWRAILGYESDLLGESALAAFTAAQNATLDGYLWIAILFARVGFIDPEATLPVHDRLAEGWLRGKAASSFLAVDWLEMWERPIDDVRAELDLPLPWPRDAHADAYALSLLGKPGRLPAGLNELFWEMVGDQVDPATITPRIALFGSTYDALLKDACARAILRHPGQAEIARQPWPPRIRIEGLAGHPRGTLGYELYHLIVDNGYDPEVLDPETVTGFHPGLDGTNRRILQQHELWHLVAGYSTSPLHETAISSFQLAQFGHNYSAIFLATVMTLLVLNTPPFADPIMQVMSEGWRHGRRTRPMMSLDWPQLWSKSIAEIRAEYAIEPFASAIPDMLAPQAA